MKPENGEKKKKEVRVDLAVSSYGKEFTQLLALFTESFDVIKKANVYI